MPIGRPNRKLIEVALPLDAINAAAAREKSIRHGHPSTLHLWWARRPLAAARAVIFAQLVDDPAEYVDVLLSDPKTRRAAERRLRVRRAELEGRPAGVPAEAARGSAPTLADMAAERERERLFKIIENLVQWKSTTDQDVLDRARAEIWQSWRRACAEHADHPQAEKLFDRDRLPALHDPFAGGGSLPLEAQRLGLEAHASDLNPVAVLINKAMIEVPPKFAGRPPVNPASRGEATIVDKTWRGAQGLAEDVRHYGRWMRDEAEKCIGQLYPPVEVTPAMVRERSDLAPYEGRELTVIAWLWARTVKSPNPAFADVDVPLASTFMLSTKRGKEAYVEPVVEGRGYRFTVRVGAPPNAEAAKAGTKLSRGANFRCVMSGSPIAGDYIKGEGQAGRMGARLMAIVAEGDRGRVYLAPTTEHERIAGTAAPEWRPDGDVPARLTGGTCVPYGLSTWGDLFTPRQLVALTTFSDLVGEAMERVRRDAAAAGLPDDEGPPRDGRRAEDVPRPDPAELPDDKRPPHDRDTGRVPGDRDGRSAQAPGADDRRLRDGGTGAEAYADAVGLYLACALSKLADRGSTICTWFTERDSTRNTFARQSIPMTWDFAELNTLLNGTGSFLGAVAWTAESIEGVAVGQGVPGVAGQADAGNQSLSMDAVVSTDPPYYDNIGYADLSDFFYVWLRRSLKSVFPDLFATLAVPKAEELVASPALAP